MENKNYIDTKTKDSGDVMSIHYFKVAKKKSDQGGRTVDAVGQEDNKYGFGLGKARKDAKPTTSIENLVNIPKDEFKTAEELKPASREVR